MMMEISHAIEEPDGNAVVKRLSVPVGLEELMTSLTKEVLKKKPIDIYNFASDHFGQLLTLRESGGYSEPTSKIITFVNKVSFKNDNKSEKKLKDKQLARQVSLNVQPFIQDFKIVGKKSVVQKSEKRNRKEEAVKQKNEKLKASRKKSVLKQDQEKNLSLENGNKSKTKESNSEEIKKNKKVSDKTLTPKGKNSKIKKRFKSVDNFTSFSNFSMNHNMIDPEDIQINSLDKDNVSLSSENINKKNYTASALRRELILVHDEAKFTSFTSAYNPYKLRQEIRSVSKDEPEPNDELEGKILRDDVIEVANNENANTDSIEVLTINDDLNTESKIEENIRHNVNEDNKVENVEEKVCSINESDIGEDKNNDEAVIMNNNSNFNEVSVIQKEEIKNLEANGTNPVDEVKEVPTEEKRLNEPFTASNEESAYNKSKIFASAGMAALKIQSMWRGFRTRKNFPVTGNNVSNSENTDETSSKFSEPTHEIISKAASKIQAGVRGYLTRKQNKKVADEINGKRKDDIEIQKVASENVSSNNNNVFSNVEQNDNLIKSNENTPEVSLVTANSNNANDGDNQTLKEDETNILKLENYDLNNLEGTCIQENLNTDPLDLNNEKSTAEIETIKQENDIIDVDTIEQKKEPLSLEKTSELNLNIVDNTKELQEINENSQIINNPIEDINGDGIFEKVEVKANVAGQEGEFTKENLVNENENNKQGIREKRSLNFQEIIEEENNKLIDSINNSKNIAINNEPNISEIDEEINTSRFEDVQALNQPEVTDNQEFQNESTTEQDSSKTDSSLGSILQHSGELHDTPTYLSEENKLSSDSEQTSVKEDVQILMQSDSIPEFQKDSTIEQETNETDSSIGSILQHSGELHDSLTYLNEENKLSSDSEQKSTNEDIHTLMQQESRDSIENNQKEESSEINSSVDSILQHSGELHDIPTHLNEENKLSSDSEQNLTSEDVTVLIQSEVTESIGDNQELQKDSATEKESSKTDQPIGSILQHSGELHDVPTYFKEENKLSSDSTGETEEKEEIKPLSNLEHSGELHDLILVENNNNQGDEVRKREENTLQNIEALIESDDEINGKNVENIENKESETVDKIHYVNIIEDSTIKLEDAQVEEIEEEYRETKPQDMSKLRTDLYEIEETTEDDDSTDNNSIQNINVVSQFNDIIVDREQCEKEAKSEDAEQSSLGEKDANAILEGESEVILQSTEENDEIINAENINKSDDLKIPTELNEKEKLKVPEDDLIQSETVILQLAESPSASKQGDDHHVSEECIEDVKLQHLDEETTKSDKIVNIDSNNFDISKLQEEEKQAEDHSLEKNKTKSDNEVKVDGNEEELTETKISVVNGENMQNSEIENDITEVNVQLDEDLEKNNVNVTEQSENTKIKENVDIVSEPNKFDVIEVRAELDAVQGNNTEDPNLVISPEGKSSFEKNNNEEPELVKIDENVEIVAAVTKFDPTKLHDELDKVDKINDEDLSLIVSTENKTSFGNEENVESEENVKVESDKKKFDITKLRAELDEAENSNSKDIDIDTSTIGKDSVEENRNDKEESIEMESVKVESEGKKFDITKLRAELSATENSNAEDMDSGTPTNGNESVEKNNNDKEENAEVERVKVEGDGIKFDITKLRAELSGTENSNAEDVDSSTPTNGNDSVEKNNNDKEENAEIESVKAEGDGIKFDITKLRAELSGKENSNAEDVHSGTPTNGNDSVENNNNDKEENAKIESVKVESDGIKFDITKLRAELSGTENSNAEGLIDSGTPTNGNNSVEKTNNDKEENAEIESVKVEGNGIKFDITKLRAELSGKENSNAEDVHSGTPTNGNDSVENNNNDKEENAKIESVKDESDGIKFDITKLRAELSGTEHSNAEGLIDSSTPTNGNNSVEKTNNEKEEDAEIESVKVEGNGIKFDITKLRAELSGKENSNAEDVHSGTPTNGNDSIENNNNDKEENAKIESVKVESDGIKFDITKLRAELSGTEHSNAEGLIDSGTPTNGNNSVEKTNNDKEENAEIESVKVEGNGIKFDITKLRAELSGTDNSNAEELDSGAPTNGNYSVEKNNNDKEETAEVDCVKVEGDGIKFDITKLRAQLSRTENSNAEDVDSGTPTNGNDIVEKNNNGKEENAGIESVKVEGDGIKFDITKLRAELSGTENSNAEDLDSGTTTDENNSVEKNNNDKEENAEIESVKVESDGIKFDITKLRAELDGVENASAQITDSVTPINEEKNFSKKEDVKEESVKIDENVEVESTIQKFDITKLRAELNGAENLNVAELESNTPTNGKEKVEKNKSDQEENAEIKSVEVESDEKKFDITKLHAELDEAKSAGDQVTDQPPANGKDSVDENKNDKEENAGIEVVEVENNGKKFDITKLRAELNETENSSSKDIDSDTPTNGKDSIDKNSNDKDENAKIETNTEVESDIQKFDIGKLHAELNRVESSNIVKTNGKENVEQNGNDNEENAKTKDVEVESDIKNFDVTKLRAELDEAENSNSDTPRIGKENLEESKNENSDLRSNNTLLDDSSGNNIKESSRTEESTEANVISNEFDFSKSSTELNDTETSKVPEEELDNSNNLQPINENESHSILQLESTPQLHLIDKHDNNNAIKPNTTDDVDQQLTVINNDFEDGNKCLKNVNSLQAEPLPTTHSIIAKEFEFIPTESSDNLIISPNDSNQSFSNKEIEPKINKEVMTNTNQESNFNQTSLNNETNNVNQQDDMTDERAPSGISASPDSDVTVIFNSNTLNKLDDNLVNISGNSSPTVSDKAEVSESVAKDTSDNIEKNALDISKLIMDIEDPSKVASKEEVTQEQKEDSMSGNSSEHKLKEIKTKDTLNDAATVIQSIYRGYQVRTKLKDSIKKERVMKTDESKKEATYPTNEFNLIETKKEHGLENEDFAISDVLGNVLNQQLAIAAPHAVEVDKSGNQPEYIHIPLKGSMDESGADENSSLLQLQHSGEFHDIFPIPNVPRDISKINKLDETVTQEDNIVEKKVISPNFTENKANVNDGAAKNSYEGIEKSTENENQAIANNSLDDDKNIVNEENVLKLNKSGDGSVPQALGVVLNQQLAIATPCAKFEEKEKETEKVDYIHIPLKDPNGGSYNDNIDLEVPKKVDEMTDEDTTNSLSKQETNESANKNDEPITDTKQFNQSASDVGSGFSPSSVNKEDENSEKNKVLMNYSLKTDGSIQDESMPMVVQNTQLSENTMPVEGQPNQAPGAEILTSSTSVDETEASLIIENAEEIAQTSEKDASSKDEPTKNGAHLQTSMETSNRENTTRTEQNMENVAATKIQASFRGYQVRKQLKPKNGGVDSITLRRSLRRKSSGKLRGSENASKKQTDNSSDLEEKSATKIQAGIRGFLVRRRQTKAKTNSQKSS